MKQNVIIIGCSICSLYAGIKFLDLGYSVSILDRKKDFSISDLKSRYVNYIVYNSHHTNFIQLLKMFGIQGKKIRNINHNDDFFSLLKTIKVCIENIPPKYLETTSAFYIFDKCLPSDEMNYLMSNNLEPFMKTLNIKDFMDMFLDDMSSRTYYYLDDNCLQNLVKRMIQTFLKKKGLLNFEQNIYSIHQQKSQFVLNNNFVCDILFTMIGQHNLLLFDIWEEKHKNLLRKVSPFDSSIVNKLFDSILKLNYSQKKDNVENVLLEQLHIVYPKNTKTKKLVYLWKHNVNVSHVRDTIRGMFHPNFIICSESFSKNNIFINYSIEDVDNLFTNLTSSF